MSVFETSVDDALGLWTNTAQIQPVSFGVGEAVALPDGPVYRVNLSAQDADSAQVFSNAESAFLRMDSALAEVPDRLNNLVVQTHEQFQNQDSAISFDVLSSHQQPGLDGDLLMMLADVDRSAANLSASGEVSFGIGEIVSDAWSSARAQFDALITQIDRDLLHFAWVETSISGKLIARTSVDWSGDAQTVWDAGMDGPQAAQHQRAIKFVTQTRGLRFRLFVTVTSGAARVAGLLVTPGGAVLALPAVYQYVTRILAQARELQSIQP